MHGTILQAFHWYMRGNGYLWPHLRDEAKHLKEIGFTSIWLPPAYKGIDGSNSIGYDIYDLYDLGEFDQKGSVATRYGTKEQYMECVQALQNEGLRVMVDIVLNHKAGGDEVEKIKVVQVNPDNRNKVISVPMEIEAHTKFTFPGRNKKYSAFIWDYQCFTGVDNVGQDGENIYKILNGNGELWQDVVGNEKGNYDFLMFDDIDYRNPAVREEVNKWGQWYYDQLHFDAVRLDAVKHMPPDFIVEWVQKIRAHAGKDIFAVAEYWAPGFLDLLQDYIKATNGTMAMFDCSLQSNFHYASKQSNQYDMREIFNQTLVQANPELAVTVVSNHDTQPLQALESVVEAWFKPLAYALILLRVDGYPSVFYPDLYGASYKDKGHDGNEYEIWLPKINELENLLMARRLYAYGHQRDYLDHHNCIGFTREGDDTHTGCAVIMSNGAEGFKKMETGTRYSGKTFYDLLGHRQETVHIDEHGFAEFHCNAGSVSVWIEKTG